MEKKNEPTIKIEMQKPIQLRHRENEQFVSSTFESYEEMNVIRFMIKLEDGELAEGNINEKLSLETELRSMIQDALIKCRKNDNIRLENFERRSQWIIKILYRCCFIHSSVHLLVAQRLVQY